MIPTQLKREEFKFVLIKQRDKAPFENEWQLVNNYKYYDSKLIKHISEGGNYEV